MISLVAVPKAHDTADAYEAALAAIPAMYRKAVSVHEGDSVTTADVKNTQQSIRLQGIGGPETK